MPGSACRDAPIGIGIASATAACWSGRPLERLQTPETRRAATKLLILVGHYGTVTTETRRSNGKDGPSMLEGLEGQVALVTGGGAGIGESAVRLLAQAGAHVAILDRNGAAADAA